jgi:hypothetical protein
MAQADYLDECMSTVDIDSSIQEFKQAFCSRCMRDECTHSGWGESTWLQRIHRQSEALENPNRLDPSRSDLQEIVSQDFEDIRNIEQDAWSIPNPSEREVHQAEPSVQDQPSDQVDASVEALDRSDNPEHFQHEQNSDISSSPEDSDSDPPSSSKDSGSDASVPNTDVPDEGIMIDGDEDEQTDSDDSPQTTNQDDWTHPDHTSDGGLTVNIDDGTRVDD